MSEKPVAGSGPMTTPAQADEHDSNGNGKKAAPTVTVGVGGASLATGAVAGAVAARSDLLPIKTFEWILDRGLAAFALVIVFILGYVIFRLVKHIRDQDRAAARAAANANAAHMAALAAKDAAHQAALAAKDVVIAALQKELRDQDDRQTKDLRETDARAAKKIEDLLREQLRMAEKGMRLQAQTERSLRKLHLIDEDEEMDEEDEAPEQTKASA